jgi:ATPase subunit of ABC transporter with duplicated ATPase domains
MTPRNSGAFISFDHQQCGVYLKSRFPDAEKISPPLLQLSNVTFGYTEDRLILKDVDIDVGADSRIAVVGQ